jgi:tetratricopeptide (TPR) repeat protein
LDSGYALAYTGLAGAYILKATTFGAELSALESIALAEPLLETSLGIDPDLIETHMWIGFCYVFKYWDFEAAESEYKKAIVSNNIDALYVYADLLNFTKRHDEALAINEKMAELEPYYPNNQILLSLYFTDQQEKAFNVSKERISMFNNYLINDNYGFLMLNTGKYEKAIDVFEKVMEVAKVRYPRMLGWSGAAYAHLGLTNKALALIEELKEESKQTKAGSHPFFIAVIYSALNDKKAALTWLQKSFDQHDMELPWLVTEPQFRPLHDEPVFQELVKKIGFP